MAVKIRLARRGRKKLAIYDIVVADSRSPRDGKIIEKIGTYNPNINPASIIIDNQKALDWLMKGGQPSETVRAVLSYKGILFKKHLQVGVNKKAITQEEADKKFNEWLKEKKSKINNKIDSIEKSKKEEDNKRLENEQTANKKKLDEIKQKLEEVAKEEAKEKEAKEKEEIKEVAKEEAKEKEEVKEEVKEVAKEEVAKEEAKEKEEVKEVAKEEAKEVAKEEVAKEEDKKEEDKKETDTK